MEDRTFSIDCFACGGPAATIRYTEKREFGPTIAQTGFIADVFAGMLGPHDATPELFSRIRSLARNDLEFLRSIDPDFFAFICGRCRVAYCLECWQDVHEAFDDGFYDETRGTCPRGHEQSWQD